MNQNPLQSLQEIKSMMQRTSKFTSISGWSGVWVGVVGLLAALVAYFIIFNQEMQLYGLQPDNTRDFELIILAFVTLVIACVGGFYFMIRKTNKDQEKFITPTTKRILIRFIFVLLIGAAICFCLYRQLSFVYMAPTTLLFYGLVLYNIARDTVIEIKYLAYTEILLGIFSFYFIANGLLFWALGFGLAHVIFGLIMVKKYENKP